MTSDCFEEVMGEVIGLWWIRGNEVEEGVSSILEASDC